MNDTYPRLLLVGNPQEFHLGGHLISAAKELGIDTAIADIRSASRPGVLQKIHWKLFDHRPIRMADFQRETCNLATQFSPGMLLVTGMAPIERETLKALGSMGILRANYLTDDPFNPAHRSRWFLDSLKEYDFIFSPRHSNEADLMAAGTKRVVYVPFGYNPRLHYSDEIASDSDLVSDILFVGGADADRIPMILELIRAGLDVSLYGRYWDRVPEAREACRGVADQVTLRRATGAARVTLVLVRRSNRDGHVMRSYEAAASGGCLIVEDTPEHREIFEDTVAYFDGTESMVGVSRELIANPERRNRLKRLVHDRIVVKGANRYEDRLRMMLKMHSQAGENR